MAHECNYKWWFWDETDRSYGPYASKELAEIGEECYKRQLNGKCNTIRNKLELDSEEKIEVLNLLAVIHRDGGQYTTEKGIVQSCVV